MVCLNCKSEKGIVITEISMGAQTLVVKDKNRPQKTLVVPKKDSAPEKANMFQCVECGHTEVTLNDIDDRIVWPGTFTVSEKA
jgi:DNA-directed RNA polymerase subunit M/transcription elongation factor TFIIS